MAAISFKAMGPGEGLRPQVEPQLVKYGELKAIKDAGNLIPGQWYRITDYVTTVNGITETNARSAGHAFDVLVMATDVGTLSEDALAVRHDGDTYFENSRLEAWELKFRLENEKWSKQNGTYVVDANDGYAFLLIGDITLAGHTYKLLQGFGTYVVDWSDYALMETVAEGEQIICYYGDPEDFDPEEPEVVGTASGVEEVTEAGKGTITWMKDEHGNECPYDFKNIQYKRWKATDSASGRSVLRGKYMVASPDNCPPGLSVEDAEDFIWVYTFSSDNAGGDQTDFSLGGHNVHDNVFKPYGDLLPNNVMFGGDDYGNSFGFDCYNNSWDYGCYNNSWGNGCYNNSCGDGFYNNSWGNRCYNNSCGRECYNNSWGNICHDNSCGDGCNISSLGNECNNNSWGNNCRYNSCGHGCRDNSCGKSCNNNSWGNNCHNNSWGNNVTQSTLFDGVQYTQITTENVKNAQVLNGVAGTSSSKLTLGFQANKAYTQVAAKNSNGQLVIYVPGDVGGGGDPQDVLFAYLNERLVDIVSNQTVKELVCIYGEGDGTQASVLGFLTDGGLYYPMFNSVDQGFAFIIGGTIDATTDQFVITAVNGSDEIDSDVYNTIEGSVDGVFSYDDAQGSQLDYLTSYLVGKKLNIFYC